MGRIEIWWLEGFEKRWVRELRGVGGGRALKGGGGGS